MTKNLPINTVRYTGFGLVVVALFVVLANPVQAMYDPEIQKDCVPESKEVVCLMRTSTPATATENKVVNAMTVAKAIVDSTLPLDLKIELLQKLISGLSNLATTNEVVYTYGGGTATFSNGKYSFKVGCNTVFGTYTQNGDKVVLSAGASTLMACAEDLMNKDTQLAKDLATITTIKTEGVNIILTGSAVEIKLIKK